ncbi:MAG TPA: hypothetical protein DCP28_35075 [Cytophagales bacterium]|nr:hypothetical protein [Cytophagales bacterium]
MSIQTMERAFFDQTNALRFKKGLVPYQDDRHLSSIARQYAQVLMRHGFIDHTSPEDNSTPGERALQGSYKFQEIRENLGQVRTLTQPVTIIMKGLIKSPGHYRNLVSDCSHCGMGVAKQGLDVIVVQLFSKPIEMLTSGGHKRDLLGKLHIVRSSHRLPPFQVISLPYLDELAVRLAGFPEGQRLSEEQMNSCLDGIGNCLSANITQSHDIHFGYSVGSTPSFKHFHDLILNRQGRAIALGLAQDQNTGQIATVTAVFTAA